MISSRLLPVEVSQWMDSWYLKKSQIVQQIGCCARGGVVLVD